VTRNQTSRDRDDKQQPFNLRVPGGAKTLGDAGKVYDIAHYQILQGNQVRGYDNDSIYQESGRRVIAQPMSGTHNPANAGGPAGSVKIAADGSTATFVPANRALSWQTTDASGNPVVRERVWVTMQPGEIRTCAGCHGENSKNQAGLGEPLNKPEALRQLLRYWKQNNAPVRTRINGSKPRVRGHAAASQAVPTAAAQPVITNPANVAGARPAGERRTISVSPYELR
jgi:hydrazine synthase alpha subunit-like protein